MDMTPELQQVLTDAEIRIRHFVDLLGEGCEGSDLMLHELENLTGQEGRTLLAPAILLLWQHRDRLLPSPSLGEM